MSLHLVKAGKEIRELAYASMVARKALSAETHG